MNIKKAILQSAFSFIVVNFVEKSVLHYTGLYKRALRNEQLITSNADNLKEKSKSNGNTKSIGFQFQYGKFSQQRYSTFSYSYRHVTKEVGEVSPALSRKLEKDVPIFRENCQFVA